MLKENSFKENDMIAMRLNGGEEIIGKFVKQDDSLGYYLYNSGSNGLEITEVSPASSSFWETEDPEE